MRRAVDLAGRVVVITGAARGLGAELARQLAARGARLALLGLEPGELADVSASCPGSAWWELDVTDEAAVRRVADEVVERFGGVDVLVANAGIAAGGMLLTADVASYDRVITVNLFGSIRTVRAFLPHVIARKGYILQVASVAALLPAPFMSAYGASKAGVEGFAHALRAELRVHDVDVGVAYLSWTDTAMVRGADETPGLRELRGTLPGLFGKTYPLAPSVAAIVEGVARRAPHIYAQRWVRALAWFRGALPSMTAHAPRGRLIGADQAIQDAGVDATKPVGAGGAADTITSLAGREEGVPRR
jgi:NAD(P)-dependent dehydrogenase (short-subunit alcohol dehydrogenase family)